MNRYVPVLQNHVGLGPFDLEELVDKNGVLEIRLLGSSGHKLSLVFDAYLAYRKIDEGDAMAALAEVSANGVSARFFYTVENSEFVQWLVEQSYGVRAIDDISHYAIHTINDIVDVLSLGGPSVRAA